MSLGCVLLMSHIVHACTCHCIFYLTKTKQAQLFNCNAMAMLQGDVNMLRSCSLPTVRARVLRSRQHLKNQAALHD